MEVTERLARFVPVALQADRRLLDGQQYATVQHLIAAGRQIQEIYLRQVWGGNPALRAHLAASTDPLDRTRLRLFDLMGGPWDRTDGDVPFVGDQPRPPGAAFYPEDLTPEEFNGWLEEHPEDRPAFTGYFTLIRREGEVLQAVPYHQAYRPWLEAAAEELLQAAQEAEHAPLHEYLKGRAQSLLNDDYYDSDCAWVALQDSPIEAVIGPYEVYDDKLFGYKAAYECMVGVRDPAEGARLRSLVGDLPALAAHLPVPGCYQGTVAGLASPIVVVDTVFNAGEIATAAIATAFVLPNDPRVRGTIGTKKVMLKNVARAKFENILFPVAQDALEPDQVASVTFDLYFSHVLLHEISHALGPRQATSPDGSVQPVHQALRDCYSTIEECKADIVGLYNLLYLAAERAFPPEWQEAAPAGYLASILRMVRLGTAGAHARGNLLGFNFLWENGAIRQDRQTGRLQADPSRTAKAVEEMCRILLQSEGDGDYNRARALIDRYVRVPPELQRAQGLIRPGLPLDLVPLYPWAGEEGQEAGAGETP